MTEFDSLRGFTAIILFAILIIPFFPEISKFVSPLSCLPFSCFSRESTGESNDLRDGEGKFLLGDFNKQFEEFLGFR